MIDLLTETNLDPIHTQCPNGLRVIRDIDPALLKKMQANGADYTQRRWERHDGTFIAECNESSFTNREEELASLGITRWKLQKILFEAVLEAEIPFWFNKSTETAEYREDEGLVEVQFADGTSRKTEMLIGCDGGDSAVRYAFAGDQTDLQYQEITCLMGLSDVASDAVAVPTSSTSDCHALYFPTGPQETCFQIYYKLLADQSDKDNWGNLSQTVAKKACENLGKQMWKENWDERYIQPLLQMTHAVRVGFCLLEPSLEQWAFGKDKRVVLAGDSAHPPVPFL